jgi:tricarballylate dehydrogenase
MVMPMSTDVVVVGAGNAGLCAAAAAVDAGASVILLEKARAEDRGGNTQFTICFAFPYEGVDDLAALCPEIDGLRDRLDIKPYGAAEFLDDLMKQSGGLADRKLMEIMVEESMPTMTWLTRKGLKWEVSLEGAWEVDGRLHFQALQVLRPPHGGRSVIDVLFDYIERSGADIRYEAGVTGLLTGADGAITGVSISGPDGEDQISAKSVVLAAGGFEASPERRAKYLGPNWRSVKVRGSRYNTGECLDMARALGAGAAGQWDGCHATQVHASSGDYEIGDRAFPHAYPLSVLVNINGDRFVDEGRNFHPYTYATLGRAVLDQPDGVAYQVFDAKTKAHRRLALLGDIYDVVHAEEDTLGKLAISAGIRDSDRFVRTVEEYNAAVQDGSFDPSRLDGKHTLGLSPDKSNWALPLDTPPFEAYPVNCGITFTYGGLNFNPNAEVLHTDGHVMPGLYVAGEMAGTMFNNYVGCSGLTKGAVFGRIAGTSAAQRAVGGG